jgi:anthranilate synthase/aminodeoxychorismate synthase-like glutamine amidotransferase
MPNTLGVVAALGQIDEPVHVLVVDHYDSFTFNLVQLLETLGARCEVVACDAVGVDDLRRSPARALVLSPGPCAPARSGVSLAAVRALAADRPILGVCLGHQVIAEAFGGRVVRARRPVHGKPISVRHDGRTVYAGLEQPFVAVRYNSLVVAEDALPSCLEVSARSLEGEIMGLRHRELPVEGIQFHPESVLSEVGAPLLSRWLALVTEPRPAPRESDEAR